MPWIKAYTFQFNIPESFGGLRKGLSFSFLQFPDHSALSYLLQFILFILSLGYGFSHYFKTTITVTKNFFYFILQLYTKHLARGSMKGLGDFPPQSWNHRT